MERDERWRPHQLYNAIRWKKQIEKFAPIDNLHAFVFVFVGKLEMLCRGVKEKILHRMRWDWR